MTSETAPASQSRTSLQKQQPTSGRNKKARHPRKSTSSGGNPSRKASTSRNSTSALHEAARNYAMRHQQRQQSTNTVKKWFVDRFYFPDPTQVPPSEQRES
ncbi:hypothetical protein GGI05_006176, partial [Coemansia sp. RSA 2603]